MVSWAVASGRAGAAHVHTQAAQLAIQSDPRCCCAIEFVSCFVILCHFVSFCVACGRRTEGGMFRGPPPPAYFDEWRALPPRPPKAKTSMLIKIGSMATSLRDSIPRRGSVARHAAGTPARPFPWEPAAGTAKPAAVVVKPATISG